MSCPDWQPCHNTPAFIEGKTLTVVGFDFYRSLYSYESNEKIRKDHLNGNLRGNPKPGKEHNPNLQLKYIKNLVKGNDDFIPIGFLRRLIDGEI